MPCIVADFLFKKKYLRKQSRVMFSHPDSFRIVIFAWKGFLFLAHIPLPVFFLSAWYVFRSDSFSSFDNGKYAVVKITGIKRSKNFPFGLRYLLSGKQGRNCRSNRILLFPCPGSGSNNPCHVVRQKIHRETAYPRDVPARQAQTL